MTDLPTQPRRIVKGSTDVSGPTRTKQSFRERTDLNYIVKNHTEGGHVPLPTRPAIVGDFSQAVDLRTALEQTAEAWDAYNSLPADVRTASINDPVRFFEMLATPEGTQHLVDAGLSVEGFEPTPPPEEPPADKAAPEGLPSPSE